MRRLAKDAQKWVELRSILQDQVRGAKEFVTDYCQYFNANNTPEDLQSVIEEFEQNTNTRIGQLDQTSRDLLQIEFAWASITETRISTRLGQNVMLLTYALWAIPNINEGSTRNPFIITSVIVGLVTLLIAFNLEKLLGSIGQVYNYWRTKVIEDMRSDKNWKEKGERLEDLNPTWKNPSEWWLFEYMAYKGTGLLTGRRRNKREQPKLNTGGTC
ncbi:hypothetical protein F5B22DRAFT_328250 [Xylaria bambusicola]|uniref:uncharacterized protein n=1 Tax=Xylaria bambusicola TaxID=326684 RepID=UPI002007614A|nr:uncharacterized protein F5B22DRAFT_328250 [Xylaria bambusicola]KAI0509403.1 hypothetical protein F5B22DRAFT_328250 [Xylaria bambusicola]